MLMGGPLRRSIDTFYKICDFFYIRMILYFEKMIAIASLSLERLVGTVLKKQKLPVELCEILGRDSR